MAPKVNEDQCSVEVRELVSGKFGDGCGRKMFMYISRLSLSIPEMQVFLLLTK